MLQVEPVLLVKYIYSSNYLLLTILTIGIYKGNVYIYYPLSQFNWKQIQSIPAPLETLDGQFPNSILRTRMNFGIAVAFEETTHVLAVSADAYGLSISILVKFFYY